MMNQPLKPAEVTRLPIMRTVEAPDVELHELVLSQSDPDYNVNWTYLSAKAPVWFSREVLISLRRAHLRLLDALAGKADDVVRYQIMASDHDGIFSLGGDLGMMVDAIRARDRDRVAQYARVCLELIMQYLDSSRRNITNIALVQGAAMGGGFEAALAHDYIVAERGARFGFPEVHFNMFPGMGAYTLLKRRVGGPTAERMIVSGHTYSAETLHDMGIIDMLAEKGNGIDAALLFIRKLESRAQGAKAFRQALRGKADDSDRLEMKSILEAWIDQAMTLSERDLRTMEYMRRSQMVKLNPG